MWHLLARVRLLARAVVLFPLSRAVVVEGWSMAPTLESGERALAEGITYRLRPVRRGEVALARAPDGALVVKRVVALEGDRVEIRNGRVLVNGTALERPLLHDDAEQGEWQVPPGHLFLMGDAPALSTDCRHWGPLPLSAVVGRVWLVFWPPGRFRLLD